jgi:hypothetical protein
VGGELQVATAKMVTAANAPDYTKPRSSNRPCRLVALEDLSTLKFRLPQASPFKPRLDPLLRAGVHGMDPLWDLFEQILRWSSAWCLSVLRLVSGEPLVSAHKKQMQKSSRLVDQRSTRDESIAHAMHSEGAICQLSTLELVQASVLTGHRQLRAVW